ncbi:hypothetical protein ASPVEDRAFT_79635 [Aspergillus versicolor CBS 583.65]|uniref:DUF4419 domain-containing protein n=1 Tax=Aspergillus versicolor CBS 583.65 TaxID=1036611 RepID=A0A1L9P912_ASPVE|nr:uncharacterized protein ASPVEDRAFT_79635 [Aspergillus versicolor CBS 583.65]OJI97963.1 hypothetical protein ASPVEDRAFT_79635 [Aspergillus versicolor CBS 583.65]
MPISFTTAEHPPRKWEARRASNIKELFEWSCHKDYRSSERLMQHSFPPSLFRTSHISPSHHGFVWAVFLAYSGHQNLTVRPEDVWFSILTQVRYYINAHAEELRSSFVSHEGKKELVAVDNTLIGGPDFGAMALKMAALIEQNIVDKELRSWIMPNFSTTTESDDVVAAILMMGAMEKYFSYVMVLCGIPSVTLLGEREDWVILVEKLEKLHQLGDEPARFAQLLRPILNHFVASFDYPESPEVVSFWNRCAHRNHMMSGVDYLCGWLSVFCFWDEDGKLLYPEPIHPTSSLEFHARNTVGLEDAVSRRVDTSDIPSGFASVPVTVKAEGREYEAMMVAGLIGIQATSSGAMLDGTRDHKDSNAYRYDEDEDSKPIAYSISPPTEEPGLDSIQPLSGWLMYEKSRAEEIE